MGVVDEDDLPYADVERGCVLKGQASSHRSR